MKLFPKVSHLNKTTAVFFVLMYWYNRNFILFLGRAISDDKKNFIERHDLISYQFFLRLTIAMFTILFLVFLVPVFIVLFQTIYGNYSNDVWMLLFEIRLAIVDFLKSIFS